MVVVCVGVCVVASSYCQTFFDYMCLHTTLHTYSHVKCVKYVKYGAALHVLMLFVLHVMWYGMRYAFYFTKF